MALEERQQRNESNTVVGTFRNGEDAHRAIQQLLEEGFLAGDIGAAFATDNSAAAAGGTGEYAKKQIRTQVSPGTVGSGSGMSGSASDTAAVTPALPGSGSGTTTAGASRPQPGSIPGTNAGSWGEVEHTGLPSELSHEPQRSSAGSIPATGGFHDEPRERTGTHSGGWGEKLKHIFTSHPEPGDNLVSKSSMNFGTGEGHIGAAEPAYEYDYSGPAFESSFSGMGLGQERSRSLSQQLSRGGAVVTVNAAGRVSDAERVLERNQGVVNFETPGSATEELTSPSEASKRVQVFGEVQRSYPAYLGGRSNDVRRAS